MAAMTDYLESALINHVFRSTAYTAPTQLNIALFTAAPSDTGGGTEVSGGSYARVNAGIGTSNWAATSGGNGTTSNVNAITFTTATGSWGTVTHVGIFDQTTNLLWWGALTTSKTVGTGDTFSFAAGALTVQIDN